LLRKPVDKLDCLVYYKLDVSQAHALVGIACTLGNAYPRASFRLIVTRVMGVVLQGRGGRHDRRVQAE